MKQSVHLGFLKAVCCPLGMSNRNLGYGRQDETFILRRLQDELLGGHAAVVFSEMSEKAVMRWNEQTSIVFPLTLTPRAPLRARLHRPHSACIRVRRTETTRRTLCRSRAGRQRRVCLCTTRFVHLSVIGSLPPAPKYSLTTLRPPYVCSCCTPPAN